MSLPPAWDLDADIVGCLVLAKLDTAHGILRFILNEEGWFDDAEGNRWLGSKLFSISEVEFSIGGTAPLLDLSFSYTVDPDVDDLVSAVREYGVDAVRNRPATLYLQPLITMQDIYAATVPPVTIMTGKMMSLRYGFEGAQNRSVSVLIEGAMNLRARPPNGRYTDTDQRRRTGVDDPSFEYMPNNAFDEQPLFGL